MSENRLHVIEKRQPLSSDALERLDEISALIRAKDVKDISIVAVTRDGDVKTYSCYTSAPRLLGAMEWAQRIVVRKWEGE